MAGGRDEVKYYVYAIVHETRITLDSRLFSKDMVVLSLKVLHDLGETGPKSATEKKDRLYR